MPSSSKEIEFRKKKKQKALANNDYKEAAEECHSLGSILRDIQRIEEAIAEHEEEKHYCEALNDQSGVALAHRKIGECYSDMQEYSKALKHHYLYLKLSQKEESQIGIQRAYLTIGKTYLDQAYDEGNRWAKDQLLRKSEGAFLQSLQVAENLKGSIPDADYWQNKLRLLLNLGLVSDYKGTTDNAMDYVTKALRIAKKNDLQSDIQLCSFNLADMYLTKRNYNVALENIQASYETAVKMKDKSLQKDCLSLKARICLNMKNPSACKHCLKKIYKMTSTKVDPNAFQTIKTHLLKAAKVEQLMLKLETDHDDDDLEERLKLSEKCADFLFDLGAPAVALQYYEKMLKYSLALGRKGEDLCLVYASLASTYQDLKNYTEAERFYQQEMENYKRNYRKKWKSCYLMADVRRLNDCDYATLKDTYEQCLQLAEKARSIRLQIKTLEDLCDVQRQMEDDVGLRATEEKLSRLRKQCDNDSEDSEEEEESQPQSTLDSDSEISVGGISDTDQSAAEEEFDRDGGGNKNTGARSKRSFWEKKRNERGETPLHVACIHGNLARVQLLVEKHRPLLTDKLTLQQGHPLDLRDHAGWLPLHEACNHGHAAIVEYLLGAPGGTRLVDAAGDAGVTPLIDAASAGSAGSLDIVRILLKRGANVHLKDKMGNTALDSLRDFRERNSDDLGRHDVAEIRAVEQTLQLVMEGNNPSVLLDEIKPIFDDDSEMPNMRNRKRKSERTPSPEQSSGDETRQPPPRSRRRQARSVAMETNTLDQSLSASGEEEENSEETMMLNPHVDHRDLSKDTLSKIGDDPTRAPDAYREVMKGIRSKRNCKVPKHSRWKSAPDGPALIIEEEVIGEDWMIDDLGINKAKSKMKKTDVNGFLSGTFCRNKSSTASQKAGPSRKPRKQRSSIVSDHSDVSDGGEDRPAESQPWNQSEHSSHSTNSVFEMNSEQFAEVADENNLQLCDIVDDGIESPSPPPSPLLPSEQHCAHRSQERSQFSMHRSQAKSQLSMHRSQDKSKLQRSKGISRQQKLTNFTVPQALLESTVDTAVDIGCSSALSTQTVRPVEHPVPVSANTLRRVRVKIQDKTIMIPLMGSENQTIGWLANEASNRYYKLCALRPTLSLATQDGCILASDDCIAALLQNDEEVQGMVDSWDLPPLPLRYRHACKSLNSMPYKNLVRALEQCEDHGALTLSGLALRGPQFLPVARALQCQTALTHLQLDGNCLHDDSINSLPFSTLPNLSRLSLSCNQLTHAAVKYLAEVVTSGSEEKPLQLLETLDLSHNRLGDLSSLPLSTLLKHLPSLATVSLRDCRISAKFFQQHRIALKEAMEAASLQHIDVSLNPRLESLGVELLLKTVKIDSLVSLNLSGVQSTYIGNSLPRHMNNYLSQATCCLETAILDHCHFCAEAIDEICLCVSSPSLKVLSLNSNPKLDNGAIVSILEAASASSTSQLSSLYADGCGIKSPLDSQFLDAVGSKLMHAVGLKHFHFSCAGQVEKVDIESVSDLWKGQWGERSRVQIQHGQFRLDVKNGDI